MDWSHPVAALAGAAVALVAVWLKRRHPIRFDVTIRHGDDDSTESS